MKTFSVAMYVASDEDHVIYLSAEGEVVRATIPFCHKLNFLRYSTTYMLYETFLQMSLHLVAWMGF